MPPLDPVTYELRDSVDAADAKSLWVFGYGSLCWRPGFRFDKAVVGYVRGYSRRFWQGNSTHRGTTSKPGRVATLIEDAKGCVYGVSFAVSGEAAIPYLKERECTLGGYVTHFTTFHPAGAQTTSSSSGDSNQPAQPLRVLLYIATPKNDLWLGDAPAATIGRQIAECRGASGHNVEYLVRLADFMREQCPGAPDEHLFEIERAMRQCVSDVRELMGDDSDCIRYHRRASDGAAAANAGAAGAQAGDRGEGAVRADTFQFCARVPDKPLRCLNI